MDDKTILVIEDDELNMKLVRDILQLLKYHVLEAKNAEKGLELAREHHPDLILMDIQLPRMNGLEASRIIRDSSDLNGIPILALTSHAMQGDEEAALASGCDEHISKPIDFKAFRETVAKYCGG